MAGKKVPTRKAVSSSSISPEARQVIVPEPPGHGSTTARAIVTRADGRTLRRVQVYFEESVAKRLRLHCAGRDIDVSTFLNDLVDRTLSP